MLQKGNCPQSSCSASLPLHMVRKDSDDCRPCGDYRRLNAMTGIPFRIHTIFRFNLTVATYSQKLTLSEHTIKFLSRRKMSIKLLWRHLSASLNFLECRLAWEMPVRHFKDLWIKSSAIWNLYFSISTTCSSPVQPKRTTVHTSNRFLNA